ncbi:MAG: hypothetical protein GX774_17480 [Armatimonadetes bacterium]|nr:hypothetical protein [Armatimonadota bacterium]
MPATVPAVNHGRTSPGDPRTAGADVRLGCCNEWSGYTGIVVDDVRLSRQVR